MGLHLCASSWVTALLVLAAVACSAPAESDDVDATEGASSSGPADLIGPTPSGVPSRYPIVLAHGFNASPTQGGFRGVARALVGDGHRVYEAEVPPFQSAEVRATYLRKAVDRALADGAAKVNIIAHSMGGLDARVLISGLGYADRVAVLTTISTPHHGSAMADAVLDVLDRTRNDDQAVNGFFTLIGRTYSDVAGDTKARDAFLALAERSERAFNARYPEDTRVVYQSVAGVSNVFARANGKDAEACEGKHFTRQSGQPAYPGKDGKPDSMGGALFATAAVVAKGILEPIPNDGVVAVSSAHHGAKSELWTFLGCIPADHLGEIGEDPLKRPDRQTGFSHERFYQNLAFDLSRRGF